MMSAATRLTLRNDLAEISRLAHVLEWFCNGHHVPAGSRVAMNVALEEIVTNIISYAYGDRGGERAIDVELVVRDGSVQATVADDGRAYDPLQQEAPDVTAPLDERRVGGLGLLLVKQLMDDVRYEWTGGRNVLTIVKRV